MVTLNGLKPKDMIGNFFSYGSWFVIVATLEVPALIILIVATTKTPWSRDADGAYFGLWEFCTKNSTFTCCDSLSNNFGTTPKWIVATIVFMVFACISATLTLIFTCSLMCCSYMYHTNNNNFRGRVLSSVTAVSLLIAILVYATMSHKEHWSEKTRVSVMFGFVIGALVIYILGIFVARTAVNNKVVPLEDNPPTYWTKYTSNKPLTEWIKPGYNIQTEFVDVTRQFEGLCIEKLFMKLWKESLAGRGRDATGTGYRKVSITKIERIENPVSFEKYIDNKKKFNRYKNTAVEKIKGSRSGVLTTLNVSNSFLKQTGVDSEINEHFLFHGCNTDTIEFVTNCGLDLRKAKEGMLGKGTYGAEDPTKSDQYTGNELPNRKMFLMRVLLGEMFLTKSVVSFKNPPCKECAAEGNLDKCQNIDHTKLRNDCQYDSVLYDADLGRHKFREFVVYDQHRCYPEYLITYDRIPIS